MEEPMDALIVDLREGIGPEPRPYSEVINAWRTSCPRLTFPLLLCLALMAPPSLSAQPPEEKNCTQAIAQAQKTLGELQAKTAREKEDLQNLKQRQEALITENRRNGVSECRTWTQVMGLAFNQ